MNAGRKRIIYGFQGDGRGHLSRAAVLVRELAKHHDILLLTNGLARDRLSDELRHLPGVAISDDMFSPRLYFRKNKISIFKTVVLTVLTVLWKGIPSLFRGLKIYLRYKPQLVISDLEPISAWVAFVTGARFLSVDHQHLLTDCELEFPPEFKKDHWSASFMVKFLVPGRGIHAISSFFFPRIRTEGAHLFKPILRREILSARDRVEQGDFILVYQTTPTTFEILDCVLKQVESERFVVYNMGREYQDGNVVYRQVSVDGFIEDLASCKAVLCNGGYTLISESLFLGKPILSIPIVNSFEQILNSVYLDRLGYGQFSREFSVSEIERFVGHLDRFKANICRNDFCGNQEIVDFVLGNV